jgi:hypothetical protein
MFPGEMMPVRAIPLSRGLVAIIDPEDWEVARRFPWWPSSSRKPRFPWYAVTHIGNHQIPLHTLLQVATVRHLTPEARLDLIQQATALEIVIHRIDTETTE